MRRWCGFLCLAGVGLGAWGAPAAARTPPPPAGGCRYATVIVDDAPHPAAGSQALQWSYGNDGPDSLRGAASADPGRPRISEPAAVKAAHGVEHGVAVTAVHTTLGAVDPGTGPISAGSESGTTTVTPRDPVWAVMLRASRGYPCTTSS